VVRDRPCERQSARSHYDDPGTSPATAARDTTGHETLRHGELAAAAFRGTVRASRLNLRGLRSTLRETALSGPLELELAPAVQSVRGTLAQEGMTVSAHAVRRGDTVEVMSLHAAAEGGEVAGSGRLRLTDPLAF